MNYCSCNLYPDVAWRNWETFSSQSLPWSFQRRYFLNFGEVHRGNIMHPGQVKQHMISIRRLESGGFHDCRAKGKSTVYIAVSEYRNQRRGIKHIKRSECFVDEFGRFSNLTNDANS
jgi:hypothetical protein